LIIIKEDKNFKKALRAVRGTTMVSYGVVAHIVKRCALITVGLAIILYFATGSIKQPVFFQFPYKEELIIKQGYDIVARHVDSKRSITEHVVFAVQKNDVSPEQLRRPGILILRPKARATILMCHGFGCDKRDIAFLRIMFPEYNIMTFDFRAHGAYCEGQYCTLGKEEAFDVVGAAQFLKQYDKTKNQPVMLYGFSMGAVAAIEAQAKNPSLFKGMVLDCPFDSVQSLIRRGLDQLKITVFGYEIPIPGKSLLEKGAFNQYTQPLVQALLKIFAGFDAKRTSVAAHHVHPEESIKKITVPCFFIHCKNDEKVPVAAIKTVFNNAGTDHKQLWITGGRRHFDSFFHEPDRYIRKVQKFFKRVLAQAYTELSKDKVIDDSDHPRSDLF